MNGELPEAPSLRNVISFIWAVILSEAKDLLFRYIGQAIVFENDVLGKFYG